MIEISEDNHVWVKCILCRLWDVCLTDNERLLLELVVIGSTNNLVGLLIVILIILTIFVVTTLILWFLILKFTEALIILFK